MKSLLKLVRRLNDHELRHVSEAIDLELSRRLQGPAAVQGTGWNRQANGPSVRPLSMVGSQNFPQKRAA